MKSYKQFQQNIQEIDQNLLGPGLGAIGAVGNVLKWVGKKALTGGAMQTLRSVKGSTPQPDTKTIPKVK